MLAPIKSQGAEPDRRAGFFSEWEDKNAPRLQALQSHIFLDVMFTIFRG